MPHITLGSHLPHDTLGLTGKGLGDPGTPPHYKGGGVWAPPITVGGPRGFWGPHIPRGYQEGTWGPPPWPHLFLPPTGGAAARGGATSVLPPEGGASARYSIMSCAPPPDYSPSGWGGMGGRSCPSTPSSASHPPSLFGTLRPPPALPPPPYGGKLGFNTTPHPPLKPCDPPTARGTPG